MTRHIIMKGGTILLKIDEAHVATVLKRKRQMERFVGEKEREAA